MTLYSDRSIKEEGDGMNHGVNENVAVINGVKAGEGA